MKMIFQNKFTKQQLFVEAETEEEAYQKVHSERKDGQFYRLFTVIPEPDKPDEEVFE